MAVESHLFVENDHARDMFYILLYHVIHELKPCTSLYTSFRTLKPSAAQRWLFASRRPIRGERGRRRGVRLVDGVIVRPPKACGASTHRNRENWSSDETLAIL